MFSKACCTVSHRDRGNPWGPGKKLVGAAPIGGLARAFELAKGDLFLEGFLDRDALREEHAGVTGERREQLP